MLFLYTTAFSVAWWLGLYLLGRNLRKPLLRRAAYGLLAYAGAIVVVGLREFGLAHAGLTALYEVLVLLPALCWVGALVLLLPEDDPRRPRLDGLWRWVVVPLTLAGLLLRPLLPNGAMWVALPLLLLLLAGAVLVALSVRQQRNRRTWGLLAVSLLFFGLGLGPLIFPLAWLAPLLALLGIGLDLVLLGLAIALLDAFDEGESLRLEISRSAVGAGVAALLFGAPIGLAFALQAGPPLTLAALLFATVALAVAAQTLADPLASLLDRMVFARQPRLQEQRTALREVASALPRTEESPDPNQLDEAEFARLVRRALSHYGDLPRLATNPLTHLPAVSMRLAARHAPDDALERAAELKGLLAEGIARLKPRGNDDFGTSDEWRFYNALYFPYVVGLKPYSQRASHNGLDGAAVAALRWLRDSVPERTLYNWQNSAARLIARDLMTR
ncbi:MAG: hypothetical protein MUD01_27980 [Chloroflexaceae bacterium]|jgi:hypothetical protein|nr:hypothetical protein [Chloroflexaceae bacterium]